MFTASIPDNWELASLLCKILLYFGAASIAGGSLCLWQFSDRRRHTVQHYLSYMMLGSFVGFQAVLASFFIQVGLINGSGLRGMFDWGMASILLDTSLGDATFYRLGAFVWAMLATLLYMRKLKFANRPFTEMDYRRLLMVFAIPLVIIAVTFRLTGHVSVLVVVAQAAIILHFMAFTLWIGSLYPLLQFSRSTDRDLLRAGMKRFGDAATGIVLVLLGAGVLLGFQLFGSWRELFATPYGISFLTKLALVSLLLGIAAINKLYLVPRLSEPGGADALGRSIRIEMLAATLILAVTAYFTTIVGPVEQ